VDDCDEQRGADDRPQNWEGVPVHRYYQ